jgi:hypothetical protein
MKTKSIYLFFLIFFCINNLIAQLKYDYQWLIGGSNADSINIITWQKDKKPTVTLKKRCACVPNPDMASICDKNDGTLKYFTFGCSIYDFKSYKFLDNAQDINKGIVWDEYCNFPAGSYPTYNGLAFLPMPSDSNKYILFHQSRVNDTTFLAYPTKRLNYTIVDSKLKGGIGDATEKNVMIIYDRISEVGIRACKHGNGRDWWIIVPQMGTHGYYTTLLTPEGVAKPNFQLVDKDSISQYNFAGQSVFSPDGSTYAHGDPEAGLSILKFDRCNGKLSSLLSIKDTMPLVCMGMAISPNSRFLYVAKRNWLIQYDLWAEDVAKSAVEVGVYDGYTLPIGTQTSFYKCQLAPDGKIYIGSTNGVQTFHTIHQPDLKGALCDFKQHDFELKRRYYIVLPNNPNYNLGPKIGSPCEKALGSTEIIEQDKILVYPNPVNEQLYISSSIYFSTLWVSDITGRQVKKIVTSPYYSEYRIDTYDMENGIYFISGISENGAKVAAQRFVVQH